MVDFSVSLVPALLAGGLLAMFVRLLYLRFSRSISNRESFSAVFIPLTITTVLVISVIKSSLALSLGLVGALSIVRFRAAIKDPEELVYLFFCIAVGLTLGAERWLEATAGVFVFTMFVIVVHYINSRGTNQRHDLILSITGESESLLSNNAANMHRVIDETVGPYQVQRFECDGGHVQFRATVSPESGKEIIAIMADLQKKLPECQVSYVNLQNLL